MALLESVIERDTYGKDRVTFIVGVVANPYVSSTPGLRRGSQHPVVLAERDPFSQK